MGETRVYIQHERPTCVHVTVGHARSARSAVQLARHFATRHYGMPVGHYVSSGGRCYADGSTDYTYVYSAPDLAPFREVWELLTIEHGHATGVTVFGTASEARAALAARGGDPSQLWPRGAYVRGPVTEYRRAGAGDNEGKVQT